MLHREQHITTKMKKDFTEDDAPPNALSTLSRIVNILPQSIAKRNDCDYIIQSICPCAMYYSIYSLTFVVCMEYSVVFWE